MNNFYSAYILRNQSSEPQQIRIMKHNHEQTFKTHYRTKPVILVAYMFVHYIYIYIYIYIMHKHRQQGTSHIYIYIYIYIYMWSTLWPQFQGPQMVARLQPPVSKPTGKWRPFLWKLHEEQYTRVSCPNNSSKTRRVSPTLRSTHC